MQNNKRRQAAYTLVLMTLLSASDTDESPFYTIYSPAPIHQLINPTKPTTFCTLLQRNQCSCTKSHIYVAAAVLKENCFLNINMQMILP